MAQTKSRALDLFKFLDDISKKDDTAYDRLSEEADREFQPYVIMRWLTGTSSARQIYYLNTLVNPYVWTLHKHKKLLYNLLTTSTNGKPQRYKWVRAQSRRDKKPLSTQIVKSYIGYSTREAQDALEVLTVEDIIEYADELGYQKDEITKLKREWKDGKGTA